MSVTYSLKDNNLEIVYDAETTKPCPVNLTNHSYFNLLGHGKNEILDHILEINAKDYTPTDDELIPTGEVKTVENTPLDFRNPKDIGTSIAKLKKTAAKGYNHNYIIKPNNKSGKVELNSRVHEPSSGRILEVYSSYPGLQVYSGNLLKGQEGKNGRSYQKYGAFCLEPQFYPNSINESNWRDTVILRPEDHYQETIIYKFESKN